MTDPWIALTSGTDPQDRARALRGAHETFTAAGTVPRPVRPVVAESWQRSARARVSPDGSAQVELADDDLGSYRAEHPLALVMPLFRELMSTFATDGEHLLAVCDAQGRLLWVEGHSATRSRADDMNFVPGARWSETAMGTNAPGTAVAVDRAVQVFASEHFARQVQPWTCAAAPVHDPHTGRLLGAIDITGGDRLAHPHSLAFVQAVARAAEAQLALDKSPVNRTAIELHALGRDEALLVAGGRKHRLSRRHSELLVLLACHPEGLTGDQLLLHLYADESMSPVTLRAELSRLRGLLGPDLLASRPYRLTEPVEADFQLVERRLATGAVSGAMRAYDGPLLPLSQAPAVAMVRDRIDRALRAALADRGDPQLLADWAHSPWGAEDVDIWRALARALPQGAPERAPVQDRLNALDSEQSAATWLQPPRN
ncbi:Acetoin dehydrogenase operon transcriptional activator AcoR [Streptomyces sp. YIM 130001]|uniref:GAF domain-containing protein n=1 Tax=Streptomyces sp. YIM 130001 TaxID=2259644 RepID=UPI000E646A71|nr:GAF domain-containing protein [Streptomyces sp. YIM 130001]RII06841.1 Acetoin dehydrogenase operon transcriptional activator AcoR [Streptomyces sp. YIM 130001]